MAFNQLQKKMNDKIATVATRFHFEPLTGEINGRHFPKNISLMALSYVLNGNHLIMGDPGWGKTTVAKIVSSVMTGVPYDVFDAVEMRGNPQNYVEKTIARPNYASLNNGMESVIFLGALGTPVLNVDEVNRFSYETQDALLQGIDTGSWNYLNATHNTGKRPGFLTANYRDDGNGHLIPPLLDRMLIVTEEQYYGSSGNYEAAKKAVAGLLCDPKISSEAMKMLHEKDVSAFADYINENKLRSVSPITNEQKEEMLLQIGKIQLAYTDKQLSQAVNDSLLFFEAFNAEINFSAQYGSKRSTDPISSDTHDSGHIGIFVQKSFSPRAYMAALGYSKAMAWLLGSEAVTIDHIKLVLPHIISHKMDFSDDFINSHGNGKRTVMQELHLGTKLVELAHDHYSNAATGIKGLISDIQKAFNASNKQAILALKPDSYDHPLAKQLICEAQEAMKPALGEANIGESGL